MPERDNCMPVCEQLDIQCNSVCVHFFSASSLASSSSFASALATCSSRRSVSHKISENALLLFNNNNELKEYKKIKTQLVHFSCVAPQCIDSGGNIKKQQQQKQTRQEQQPQEQKKVRCNFFVSLLCLLLFCSCFVSHFAFLLSLILTVVIVAVAAVVVVVALSSWLAKLGHLNCECVFCSHFIFCFSTLLATFACRSTCQQQQQQQLA